jgi:adenosylcobyric acid synthase
VIAALVGAHTVLDPSDRDRIQGFLINKFRGDPRLFDAGRREIAARTGWRDLGMAPWLAAARALPPEDAVVLERRTRPNGGRVRVVTLMLPRIANFDDLDPLRRQPGVDLRFLPPGEALPGDTDLIVLPGTKSTLADLAFLRRQGWDIDIQAHVRRGGRVLGLCGGFQMLGRSVADPGGVEGAPGGAAGLGLLDVETVMTSSKTLRPVEGVLAGGGAFAGYEIHLGVTTGPGLSRPLLHHADGSPGGAVSADGRIGGAYVHGLFDRADARAALLRPFGIASEGGDQAHHVDEKLDELAAGLEQSLDIAVIERIAGL